MYTRSVRCLTSRLRLACAWIWIFRSACFNFCCRKSLLIFKVKSAGWLYEVCIYWNFFVLHTYMLRGHRAWLVVLPYSRIVSTWLMAQQMWQSRAVSIFLILRFPGTLTALRCHWNDPCSRQTIAYSGDQCIICGHYLKVSANLPGHALAGVMPKLHILFTSI